MERGEYQVQSSSRGPGQEEDVHQVGRIHSLINQSMRHLINQMSIHLSIDNVVQNNSFLTSIDLFFKKSLSLKSKIEYYFINLKEFRVSISM